MFATAAHDKFTGKHATLDIKMPDLEEPEENVNAEPVSVEDRFHSYSRIHVIILTSPSPLLQIFGIRKRRLQPLKR